VTVICGASLYWLDSGIALLKENGNLHGDPKTKAKLLNSQFSSVFSTDNTSNITNLGTSQYNEAPQITVTQNGVYKLLHGLSLSSRQVFGLDLMRPGI
jgi:hypothetical protein